MTSAIRRRIVAAVVLLAAALGPLAMEGHAFSNGPPPGFTNAPNELNCTACHDSFALNSGSAGFTISAPLSCVPGSTSLVRVEFGPLTVSTPKHGFQITARDGADVGSGSWQVLLTGLTKSSAGNPLYHEHTLAGTTLTSWTMNWVAPATLPNGPVTFYSCGNEANNAQGPLGDHIYSAKTKMYQAVLSTPDESWSIGATHVVTLSAPPSHAGELAFIVPSDDPTPVNFGGPFDLEVNPDSGFYAFALQHPLIFQNLTSTLNAAGSTSASVVVPLAPQLVGHRLFFAAIMADAMLDPTEVTNRVTVKFQ